MAACHRPQAPPPLDGPARHLKAQSLGSHLRRSAALSFTHKDGTYLAPGGVKELADLGAEAKEKESEDLHPPGGSGTGWQLRPEEQLLRRGRQVGYSHNTGTHSSQKTKSRRGVRDKSRYQLSSSGRSNQNQAAPIIQHSFLTDVSDVQEMENGLLSLLNDFHSGKLQAFDLHRWIHGDQPALGEALAAQWTNYESPSETLLSSWTPLNHKETNLQLFEERVGLLLHWFDLWTDRQRRHLLHSLLTRCTKSQLKFCRDLLMETLPVTRLDFVTVLPRVLSLYVMSFLSPRDLCAAAQVSWQWRILSEQLVLSGVKADVTVLLYDHRGTLSALWTRVEAAVCGRRAQRLGLLAPGGAEEIQLCHAYQTPLCRLLTSENSGKKCGVVVEGGSIDLFSPLAASGDVLICSLGRVVGRQRVRRAVRQPPGGPALHYACDSVLQLWCRQAEWMEDALVELRGRMETQLHRVGLQARGRALGHFLSGTVRLEDVCMSGDLSAALVEGLTALSQQEETAFDWRGVIARELHHSERVYVGRLSAVVKVYLEPLTAALNSNRAIVSFGDVQVVFTPVTQILELHRTYEHVFDVGLFLFTDVLVLTRRRVRHTPFHPAHQSTHTFVTSVALTSLAARRITHTRSALPFGGHAEDGVPADDLHRLR
ncbi:unnamed protein product [Lampetra planeri]